jgi:hypothetical protein
MQFACERKGYAQTIKTLGGTALVVTLFLLSACTTIPVEQRPQVRDKLVSSVDTTLAEFFAKDPDLEAKFNKSVGYFVGESDPSGAIGVLYDKQNDERVFLDITAINLGLGYDGSPDFKLIVLFKTTEALEEVKKGLWTSKPTMNSWSGAHGGLAVTEVKGRTAYVLMKDSIASGGTFQLSRVSINRELTELGTSETRFPSRDLKGRDTQGKAAPRKYDRELPFLAQKVVDLGFDLPLPWGFGLTMADVSQKMNLENIQVGFPNVGSPKQPYEAVAFENSTTDTRATQVKLDAWLFPFMNVFAMAGGVEGDITMDVSLDGNTILNRFDQCNPLPPVPPLINKPRRDACLALQNALQNKTFHLPVKANVNAFTYGVGTTLAAGINNWFVSVPLSINWADPAGGVTYGVTKTITPRGGRTFNLRSLGNFTAFGGGNWMESEYTIEGTFAVPGGGILEYTINESSVDPWNLVLGFNWDFTRRFSWALEYNGFIGSREATISNFVVRF